MRTSSSVPLFLLCSALSAQSWCPPGATWTYTYSNSWTTEGFARFTYVGDTIINAETCQLINAHYQGFDFPSDQPFSYDTAPMITKVTGGLVSVLTTVGFDTLYNFGALPGDHWGITMEDGSQSVGSVLIADTGTAMIDGVQLGYLVTGNDTIAKRLGSLHEFMLPWVGFIIDAAGGPLRCYEDIDLHYQAPW